MSRRRPLRLSEQKVPASLVDKVRSPLAIVLGSPAEVVHLVSALPGIETTCYQMDLFQADRLREELVAAQLTASVVTLPDLWDLPAGFQTAILPVARGGERELKIDMVDQGWHILSDKGMLLVWSPYETDPFFTGMVKKVFGRAHHAPQQKKRVPSCVLWGIREGERTRRRHEVTFQVRIAQGPSCRFLSRPGTFSYGRLDNGARALCEVMQIEPGDRVLDLGCGVGTNGIFASQSAGENGQITFVDSNVRAIDLTRLNATSNGVKSFETFATSTVVGPAEDSFDVVLANPPYFANNTIAQLFIHRAKKLLTPQGRLFLVTRQAEALAEVMIEVFGEAEGILNRGYTILCG